MTQMQNGGEKLHVGIPTPEKSLSELEITKGELRRIKTELVIAKTKLEILEKQFGIDVLTGLFNRQVLGPKLDKLINELNYPNEQRQLPLKAIMVIALDINNFKMFNEKPYNHDIGDQAMIAFSEHLKQRTEGEHDILFRLGIKGDEFRIIMPLFNEEVDFEDLFRKIKARINEGLYFKPAEESHHITASMGYSVIKKGEETKNAEQLLLEADIKEREEKAKK